MTYKIHLERQVRKLEVLQEIDVKIRRERREELKCMTDKELMKGKFSSSKLSLIMLHRYLNLYHYENSYYEKKTYIGTYVLCDSRASLINYKF